MKTTPSANKEISQKSSNTLIKRSSFKPENNSLSRLSGRKFGRKSSEGTETKRNLNRSKSISNDEKRESSSGSKIMTEASSGDESVKVTVRSSEEASLRSKRRRPVIGNKFAESMEHDLSLSMHKATCSSVIKKSKFPDHLELQPGGSQSEGRSKVKVCLYSYCSLNGPHHSALPPVRNRVSMKGNQLKTQKISLVKHSLDSSSLVQKDAELAACEGDSESSITETNHLENVADGQLSDSNNLISGGISP